MNNIERKQLHILKSKYQILIATTNFRYNNINFTYILLLQIKKALTYKRKLGLFDAPRGIRTPGRRGTGNHRSIRLSYGRIIILLQKDFSLSYRALFIIRYLRFGSNYFLCRNY